MLGYIISDKEKINVEEHKIQSFDILHKTDLNIFVIENNKVLYLYVDNIINCACAYGHVQVLEWFKNSGYEFKYNETAISYASDYGHIQVLEWFKNSGYEFKYNEDAIWHASRKGHIQVLEWFKKSGYEFKYNLGAINNASYRGNIQVLEWFKNSGYEFKYNRRVFKNKIIKILKFYSHRINIKKIITWLESKIFIKTLKFKTHNRYIKGYQKN
jgi:hypothetical protein